LKYWIGQDQQVWARHLVAIEEAELVLSGASTADFSDWHLEEAVENDLNVLFGCEYLPQLIVSGCKFEVHQTRLLVTRKIFEPRKDFVIN